MPAGCESGRWPTLHWNNFRVRPFPRAVNPSRLFVAAFVWAEVPRLVGLVLREVALAIRALPRVRHLRLASVLARGFLNRSHWGTSAGRCRRQCFTKALDSHPGAVISETASDCGRFSWWLDHGFLLKQLSLDGPSAAVAGAFAAGLCCKLAESFIALDP